MVAYCSLDHYEYTPVELQFFFIKENAFQNVICKTAAILSEHQYVNSSGAKTEYFCLFGQYSDEA